MWRMGAHASRQFEEVLDVDVGEGITEWMDDNLPNFSGSKMTRLERRIRSRLRVNHRTIKSVSNNYSDTPSFWGVGIIFNGDFKTGEIQVEVMDAKGSAALQGVQTGDVLVYVDMFDMEEVAAYFENLPEVLQEDEEVPEFKLHRESSSIEWRGQVHDNSFNSLVAHLVAGPKDSVVRLGFKRGGNPIIMYKALPRDLPQALDTYKMHPRSQDKLADAKEE